MANIVMAYIAMAYAVMAYIAMAYIRGPGPGSGSILHHKLRITKPHAALRAPQTQTNPPKQHSKMLTCAAGAVLALLRRVSFPKSLDPPKRVDPRIVMAYVFMAYRVMAYRLIAYGVMPVIVMAHLVTTFIVMAHTFAARIVLADVAHIVMAYI